MAMLDLSTRLEALGFNTDDFELRDTGDGPFIAKWKAARAQPNKNALQAVPETALDQVRKERSRRRATSQKNVLAVVYATADELNVPRETFLNKVRDIYETL